MVNNVFSYSAWSMWKKCPQSYKFAKVDKIPTPTSPALKKGRETHDAVENYITGKTDHKPDVLAKHFSVLGDQLRELPPAYKVVEEKMAFDLDQRPCKWVGPNTAFRYIWDVAVLDDPKNPTHINMGDWKTGRPYGSYDDQMQMFSIPAFLRYPSLQSFSATLVYLDTGDTPKITYTREQFENGLNDLWLSNAAMMRADESYPAKPSTEACKFCDFHPKKGGPCTVGI